MLQVKHEEWNKYGKETGIRQVDIKTARGRIAQSLGKDKMFKNNRTVQLEGTLRDHLVQLRCRDTGEVVERSGDNPAV